MDIEVNQEIARSSVSEVPLNGAFTEQVGLVFVGVSRIRSIFQDRGRNSPTCLGELSLVDENTRSSSERLPPSTS